MLLNSSLRNNTCFYMPKTHCEKKFRPCLMYHAVHEFSLSLRDSSKPVKKWAYVMHVYTFHGKDAQHPN